MISSPRAKYISEWVWQCKRPNASFQIVPNKSAGVQRRFPGVQEFKSHRTSLQATSHVPNCSERVCRGPNSFQIAPTNFAGVQTYSKSLRMCLQKSRLTQNLITVFALFAILASMDPRTMSELIAKKNKKSPNILIFQIVSTKFASVQAHSKLFRPRLSLQLNFEASNLKHISNRSVGDRVCLSAQMRFFFAISSLIKLSLGPCYSQDGEQCEYGNYVFCLPYGLLAAVLLLVALMALPHPLLCLPHLGLAARNNSKKNRDGDCLYRSNSHRPSLEA